MEDIEQKITELLYSNPNLLLSLPQGEAVGRKFLPYSLGFEFECHQSESYDIKVFQQIPNIMAVSVDSTEQRYRIPTGLKGLICLFDVANNLKIYSLLNPQSNIHIHVDFTDCFDRITENFLDEISNWLLGELDQYGEQPQGYNKRKVGFGKGRWVNASTKKTLEFRVFQQTFDYKNLLRYAVHLGQLAVDIKTRLGVTHFYHDDSELKRLRNMLEGIRTKTESFKQPITPINNVKEIVKKRVIKWN